MAFQGSGSQRLGNEDGLPQVSTSGGTASGGWHPMGSGPTSTYNPNWVSQYYGNGRFTGNAMGPSNGYNGPINTDPRSVGGFMQPSTTLRMDDGYTVGPSPYSGIRFRNGPIGVRPLPVRGGAFGGAGAGASGASEGSVWNPGPSNIGSFFSGPRGGYLPTGVTYTGSPTAYPTTWTNTPGVNGGAVPRAQPANSGGNGGGFGNGGLGGGLALNVTSAMGLMSQGSGAMNRFIRAHASQ